MKRTKILFVVGALAAAVAGAAFLALPGSAASTTPATGSGSVVQRDVISLAAAQRLANAAQKECADRGFPVTVAVVNPDGVDVLVQRADGTTGATVEVARGKAHAAAGFQSPTAGLQEQARSNPGFTSLPNFVILPGGLPIHIGDATVGGVGVSGAPSGDIDVACAEVGLKRISAT